MTTLNLVEGKHDGLGLTWTSPDLKQDMSKMRPRTKLKSCLNSRKNHGPRKGFRCTYARRVATLQHAWAAGFVAILGGVARRIEDIPHIVDAMYFWRPLLLWLVDASDPQPSVQFREKRGGCHVRTMLALRVEFVSLYITLTLPTSKPLSVVARTISM